MTTLGKRNRSNSSLRRTTSMSGFTVAEEEEHGRQPTWAARGGCLVAPAPGWGAMQRRHSGDFAVMETAAFLKACGIFNRRLGLGRDTLMYIIFDLFIASDSFHVFIVSFLRLNTLMYVSHCSRSSGHYTERAAAQLIRTIVGVVEGCHSLDVMHRDLKPENFLFASTAEDTPLKATDFGLSVFYKPAVILDTATKVLPLVVAISGRVGSDTPLICQQSGMGGVIVEETVEQHFLKHNDAGSWIQDSVVMLSVSKEIPWYLVVQFSLDVKRFGVQMEYKREIEQLKLGSEMNSNAPESNLRQGK
ncbi:hypothetical protein ABZP36_004934 [Zizania latifolia]